MMKPSKVDLIIQYSILIAGQEYEYIDRQLGPIHLIKYVYLADLAYAERNYGETFTGIAWQFYKFGPWSQAVNERIEPALAAIGANRKTFHSNFDDKNDWFRWQIIDDRLLDNIEQKLPLTITSRLKRNIHKFGQDTPSLLSYVYLTSPMLLAAPNEYLDFSHLNHKSEDIKKPLPLKKESLTDKQKKKFKEGMQKIREKNIESRSTDRWRTQLVNPVQNPKYDDVYYDGLKWLYSLAGPPLPEGGEEAVFSDSVWKSSSRRGEDVS